MKSALYDVSRLHDRRSKVIQITAEPVFMKTSGKSEHKCDIVNDFISCDFTFAPLYIQIYTIVSYRSRKTSLNVRNKENAGEQLSWKYCNEYT